MKRIVFIFFSFFICQISFSQSIDQLDRNPGYRDIQLGKPISSISSKIEYVEPTSSGGQKYRITDSSYLYLFGVKMDETFIFAFNGNITGIYVVKRSLPGATLDSSFQKKIQDALTRQYGTPMYDMTDRNSNPPRFGVAWRTRTKEAHVCTLYFSEIEQFVLTVFWGM